MVDLVVSAGSIIKNSFAVFVIGGLVGAWIHSKLTHTPLLPPSSVPPAPRYSYYDFDYLADPC
jgi:hypothetical protein